MTLTLILGFSLLAESIFLLFWLLRNRITQKRRLKQISELRDNGALETDEDSADTAVSAVKEALTSFNETIIKLHEDLAANERASTRLSRNIQKSLIFTADISSHAEKNLSTAKKLRDDVTEGSAAVEEIMASIDSLSKQVLEQLSAIEVTSDAMSEIDTALQNVMTIASERLVETDTLVQVTKQGNNMVSETDRVIRNVSEKVDGVSALISVINSIASKTNLLAMNAAIEAAHAGDAGRGFAVVAEEIRNLATSTSENAKTISSTLGQLVGEIKEAGSLSHASGEAFIEIDRGVNSVTDSFKDINRLTSEISGQSRSVVQSTVSLKNISERTAQSMEEMGIGSREIGKILNSSLDIADKLDSSLSDLMEKVRGINLLSTKISESYMKSNRSLENLGQTLMDASHRSSDSTQNRISISSIILAHINWVATSRAVMDGMIPAKDVNLIDAGSCQLGIWLKSHGDKEITNKGKLANLVESHATLHNTVRELFESVNKNDRISAAAFYENLLDESRQIVQILTTIGFDDFIKWTPSLSVGIATFDEHHQVLISLINKLFVNMEAGEGDTVLKATLEELIEYTDYHFSAEEKVFAELGYSKMDQHIVQHNALLSKARELQAGLENGQAVLTNEVLDFLQDWVTNHILKTDRQYSEFLKGKVR